MKITPDNDSGVGGIEFELFLPTSFLPMRTLFLVEPCISPLRNYLNTDAAKDHRSKASTVAQGLNRGLIHTGVAAREYPPRPCELWVCGFSPCRRRAVWFPEPVYSYLVFAVEGSHRVNMGDP